MSSAVSISKGVFVFKNGAKAATKGNRKKKQSESYYCDSLWYKTYKTLWSTIETKIQELNNEVYSNVLRSLLQFLKNCYQSPVSEIPAAALLTGINMPDHVAQFTALKNEICASITPYVCTLNGEDCQNLKYLVESLMNQLLEEEDEKVKKSQCSFSMLREWYDGEKQDKIIVIILPDFENFAPNVLQDFLLILSSYINQLPVVFVFGVATSLTVIHRSLPLHVSSKININVFQSTPSVVHLNTILENVFFSLDCPFHLGPKVFHLFTDIFLFYDLSVSGFIKNFKYAMLEHFSYGNAMALCQKKHTKDVLNQFTEEDFENVRHILSFRKLVESASPEERIKLLTDDAYFKSVLRTEIKQIMEYLANFHLFLRCLHVLVCDLPRAPLGRQVRELYAVAVAKEITKTHEYLECFRLLEIQSKDELKRKVTEIADLILNNSHGSKFACDIVEELMGNLHSLSSSEIGEVERDDLSQMMDRLELKEKLKKMSHKSKSHYEKLRCKVLRQLSDLFEEFLVPPSTFPFHEIFFFNDISIQNHIVGSHRAAVHTALNDPHYYLQCPCCQIDNDAVILATMPDISIAYKLHLECGKMINLYDWLQAFLAIVDPQDLDEDEKPKVDPHLQARFTQAVAELEYLGFVKSSKRKTDHVARLTWGG